jgi:hypothetical protein
MSGMLERLTRGRKHAHLEHAPVRCALITIPAASWPGTIHIGNVTGHRPGNGTTELHAVEIIYRREPSAAVIRLSTATGTGDRFDPGVTRTLARLAGIQAPAPDPSEDTARTVCDVAVDVHQTPTQPAYQQAYFTTRDTNVSVASWRLPLDDAWFGCLAIAQATDLTGLRAELHAVQLTLHVGDTPTFRD